ncbi:DUF397 domain-containing protein [Sphaerisporangium rubeum]|uniref:DUF397 domain-containing protein n=1 Tax=Sphaerisporangium rubeum TaxID=321317 RepID=A0A7X0M4N0_9ACTN|nr:hypothetical protein [Sphaerisporangium rubeum]
MAQWRKSSRSGSNGAQCVEVADNISGWVGVRDSKVLDGPVVVTTTSEWRSFVAGLKRQALR